MDGFSRNLRSTAAGLLCLPLLCVSLSSVCGCAGTSSAKMYCWTKPVIHKTAGKTIAVSQISGPSETAEAVLAAFMEYRPSVRDHLPRVFDQAALQRYSTIQLVAAIDTEPSDMALVHAAKKQHIDYLLSAEILEARGSFDNVETLSLSWRLLDVANNKSLGGKPMTVTRDLVEQEYPDLAAQPDQRAALIEAVARESWRLLTPHIRSHDVELAQPRFFTGAKKVRVGNEFANRGNWFAAEQIWSEVLNEHPRQHAALHNLALAHAAKQDFTTAKKLAQQALQIRDSERYQRTTVWIELMQIEFLNALELPLPREGWLFVPSIAPIANAGDGGNSYNVYTD